MAKKKKKKKLVKSIHIHLLEDQMYPMSLKAKSQMTKLQKSLLFQQFPCFIVWEYCSSNFLTL